MSSLVSVPERYVALCLQVGEHVEGFVDAYIGPDDLRATALAVGTLDPQELRDEALALLDEVEGGDLEDDRKRWFQGQLHGIECVTARLAGEDVSWSDEVERCFGVRPVHVDEDVFRASHKKLDKALPGNGNLNKRYNAWLDASQVPRETLPRAIDVLSTELRRRAGGLVELPTGESVDYETIEDEPWQAFNLYRGNLNSLVQINIDLPFSVVDLVDLVAHEAYPGHHTERASKEWRLYRDAGHGEMCVMIVGGPEAMIAEGIATNALGVALGDEGFESLIPLTEGLGYRFDAQVAEAVHVEGWKLFAASTNAARMLHEDGMSPDEAESYLQEWALHTPERAAKAVSFLMDPGSRAYVTAYTDGYRLCNDFIRTHADGFRRLLTEQLTVSSLLSG